MLILLAMLAVPPPAPAALPAPARAAAPAEAAPQREAPAPRSLAEALEGLDATMVIHEVGTDRWWRHDEVRAAAGFLPCSTFKIPNSLIALETGAIADASTIIAFDPGRHPRRKHDSDARWAVIAKDHDLRSAFRESVVWYYRDVALRIGPERMRSWIDRLDYGNRDLSAGLDRFWLEGPMTISAEQQVRFLESACGLTGSSPFSQRTLGIVRDMMRVDGGEGWSLHAKTGSGVGPDGRPLGWYVGWTEQDGRTFAFAMNMSASEWDVVFRERIPRARSALRAVGAARP